MDRKHYGGGLRGGAASGGRNKTSYDSYGAYYNRTSEAVDFSDMRYYEATREQRHSERSNRVAKKKRVKRGLLYKVAAGRRAGVSFCAVVTIAVVFVCAVGLVLAGALVMGKQMTVNGLAADLRKKTEANAVTESEIAKSYDIKEIERIATEKLGMAKPKSHQIVHINVPPQSYAVQPENASDANGAGTLGDKIRKLLNG